jgi:hypothetical protein
MAELKFWQPSEYYRWVAVQLANEWWKLKHDLRDGGFTLSPIEERYTRALKLLDVQWFKADVGMEQDGDLGRIVREFTVEELGVAIPTLATSFGLSVPTGGHLVLSNRGTPGWVGPLKKDKYGQEAFDGSLVLTMGEREIDLRPHGIYRDSEAVETTMPAVRLNERGCAMALLAPAMITLMTWGDLIESLIERRTTNHRYGWTYRVHVDGAIIVGEWTKDEGRH